MQNGSIIRSTRSNGPDVWDVRWREAGPDGRRKHRRMVIGPITQFPDRQVRFDLRHAIESPANYRMPRVEKVGFTADRCRRKALQPL